MTTTIDRGAAHGLGRTRPRNTFRVRLRLPDGTVVTDSSHSTKPAAQLRAKEIDVEVGRDTFLDPRDGRIPLTEWVDIWQETHQAGPATWSAYRSHLRLHILPRLGHLPADLDPPPPRQEPPARPSEQVGTPVRGGRTHGPLVGAQ